MEQIVRVIGPNTQTLDGLIKSAAATPLKILKFVYRMTDVSRQRWQLRNLDSRLLDDIGVDRMQALKESNRPAWDF